MSQIYHKDFIVNLCENLSCNQYLTYRQIWLPCPFCLSRNIKNPFMPEKSDSPKKQPVKSQAVFNIYLQKLIR